MKKIITTIKKMSLGIFASVLFTGSMSATTYTATQSGNWSSALTWGGAGSPGSTVGTLDNVVIPAGITVTMDMDVTVNSLVSSINVAGTLSSTTDSLIITQGTLQGTGIMNMFYVGIGSMGSMTFSGTMTTGQFVNSGASITVGGSIIINDSLILNSGSIAFNVGSTLTMNTNSNIKIDAGSMSVSTGVLAATSNYDVIYIGSSKTSGVETSISSGPRNVWVNMTDSTQTVTLGSNITVNGTLYHNTGKVAIGAYSLNLMGNYTATSNGIIQAGSTSRLILAVSNTSSSSIMLTSGSQFQYLEVNSSTSPVIHFNKSFTVDTIYLKSGLADFSSNSILTMATNGVFIWENGSFSLGTGSFFGTNSYNVMYQGASKNSSFEILGTGLQNVTVNMSGTLSTVSLSSNAMVDGAFSLNNGIFNLNSYKLYLKGTYNSTANGSFKGNTFSSIFVNNTATAFGDTLNFASGAQQLDSLSINTMASSWVWLGTDLYVSHLAFQSGGLMLINGDLTIDSLGSLTGSDTAKYVGINGSGSLIMNVHAMAGYYNTFPVGTNLGYSGIAIQLTTGTSGYMAVNAQNGMLSAGTTGANLALTQSVVNRTWNIHATQTGTLNATLKVDWKVSDEKNSFDRTHAYISHYTSSAWDATSLSAAISIGGSFYQITRTNLTSFSPFAVVDQNATTGIEKTVVANTALALYPNPTSGFATIDLKNADAQLVEIYNEIGSKVYSANITDKNALLKIDISGLASGIYYVKVATSTDPIFKKLIKS